MQKQATQLLALLAAMLIIWFVIPMIAVNGHTLLPSNSERLLAICAVSVVWLIVLLLNPPKGDTENIPSEKSESEINTTTKALNKLKTIFAKKSKSEFANVAEASDSKPQSEGIYTEANLILTKHFQNVREYLRTHTDNQKKPAYLIIGHRGSGKSSLLKHSGLKFKAIPAIEENNDSKSYFENNTNFENDTDCKDTIWQLEQQCIFIDTPGDYASSEIDGKVQTPWRTLLDLLVRKHQKHPLKAIILTVNIYELLSDSAQNTRLQLHLLKQRIQEVKKLYDEKLPLYLVFTQWDAVTGFSEFFDHLNANERKQSFAVHFHRKFSEQSVTSQFQEQYEALLQSMNRMLITCMHHEHNHKKRALISQFPLQMEQLHKYFFHVVQQLLEKMNDADAATPAAVFFTSSKLTSQPVDIIQEKLKTSFKLPTTQYLRLSNQYSKSYFIEAMFKEFVQTNEPQTTGLEINTYGKYSIYGAAAVILVAFASFCIFKFTNSVASVNQVEQNAYAFKLVQDKVHNPKAAADATKLLTTKMNETSKFWLSTQHPLAKTTMLTVASNTTANMQQPDAQASDATLQLSNTKPQVTQPQATTAKPEINSQLQNYLQQRLTAAHAEPAELYGDLKAYLMLANPKHTQTSWLYNWLQQNIVSNNIISNKVASLIMKALQQKHAIVKVDEHTLAQVRSQLTTLPPQYLAFLILQDQAQYSNANALSIKFIGKSYTIPFLFTAKGLQTLFLNNLSAAINMASHDNWVLGPINSKASQASIQTQVINLYITNYVNWWSHVLNGFQVPDFSNLKSLANYSAELNNQNTGLVSSLNIISNNINPALILPNGVSTEEIDAVRNALQQQVNSKFGNLANIDLDNLQVSLMQYNQMLYNFTQSHNNQMAFTTIKNLFENPNQNNALTGFMSYANKQPEPVRTQLLNLAKQTMPMVVKAAANYVETAWQTQVLSFFDANLQNTYPLYSKASKDSSLQNFTKFFAPGGILDSFYRNNVAPFIDTSEANWTLKSSNGLSLPLSDKLLRTLEKGRIITAMFFAHNSDKMKVQFTLQQIALMPIVKSFALNINGQSLNDQQGSRNVSTFIWPGNNDNSDTTMNFSDINGQNATSQQGGPWAWFHLLDQSFVHSSGNSQSYVVTFDVDGNEARYRLDTNNPINPFIPGIISTFRLPNKIVT